MKILLIDNETTLLNKLQTLIPGNEITRRWSDLSAFDVSSFDLVVLSGCSSFQVMGNEDQVKDEVELIKSFDKALLGICFGAQLIAHVFGGELKRLEKERAGIQYIQVTKPDSLFGGKNAFDVYEHHQWSVSEAPYQFEVLARSSDGI